MYLGGDDASDETIQSQLKPDLLTDANWHNIHIFWIVLISIGSALSLCASAFAFSSFLPLYSYRNKKNEKRLSADFIIGNKTK